jgi:hypothetical protein
MSTVVSRAGLALLMAISAAPSMAQAPVRAERPTINVGDATVFEELDVRTGERKQTRFVVTRIDADKIVSETSGSTSGARTFTRDFNPVEIKTGDVVATTYKPYFPALLFPLEIGRSWSIPFEVDAERQHHVATWQMKARVVALETVTVPAGTYQAFRIEYDGSFTTREGDKTFTGTRKETAWFALEPMRIVKRDYEQAVPARNFLERHISEMVSFKPTP